MADPKPLSPWANSASSSGNGSPNGRASRFANDNGYFNGSAANGSNGTNGSNGSNGNGHNGNGTPTTTPPPLYTARGALKTHRHSPPTKILGSIAEDGDMSPDIPIRNPKRRSPSHSPPSYHNPRALVNHYLPTWISPPKNELDNVTGPHGEKLNDARENRRSMEVSTRRKKSMKRFICIGLVLITLAALVAIGLVIGLKRMHKGNSSNNDSAQTTNQTAPLTNFPVGSYTLATYLLTQTASCTPNPSTWRCYPYTLFSTSPSTSITTLDWIISGLNTSSGLQYKISSSNNPFALPFDNAELTLYNRRSEDEYWGFSTVLEKVVYPDASITSDGASARCYYNSSMLSAKLYTKKQTTLPNNETLSASQKAEGSWPGAVEISQSSPDPPVCYEYIGGEDGAKVTLQGNGSGGECDCGYADFEDGS